MDLNALFDSTVVQLLLTLLGIIVGSAIALQWGHRNGHALGVRVGRWLPGDKVEQWIVEFLAGLREGLESTYTETTVETSRNWTSMQGTEFKVDVLKNPPKGRPSDRS